MDPAHDGSRALVEALESAELRFIYEWREAFRLSIDSRTGPADPRYKYWVTPSGFGVGVGEVFRTMPRDAMALQRLGEAYAHCHPDARSFVWAMAAVPESRVISSKTSGRVFCPSWALSSPLPYDARVVVDGALAERYRSAVRNGRQSLIAAFETGARVLPENPWVVGQLVRLLVDQRSLDRAREVARACRAGAQWCAQLLGYVLAERGEFAAADSVFASVLARMAPAERCAWSDMSLLLDTVPRRSYVAAPCAARDSLNAIVWWLADPMYSEPGNERRVEQFARKVGIALRSALERDERYDWRPGTGMDGMTEMVERYGWPSYSFWAYAFVAGAIDMSYARLDTAYHIAYATFEYAGERLQTFPAWSAVSAPLTSRASDWSIVDPHKPVPPVTYRGDRVAQELVRLTSKVSEWWPQQHFAPRAPIAQLPDGQTVFLRRQDHAVFAAAYNVAPAVFGSAGRRVDATVVTTWSPDSARVNGTASGTVGSTLTAFTPIESRPAIAAVEFSGVPGGPSGGRTRFGVAPPAPLSQMAASDVAVSDLVLLRPPLSGDEYPREPERIVASMAPSASFAKSRRLGVYWETYGFAPTDSVELAVWIERYTPQGILRRFGIALSVATDQNTPIAHAWTETSLGRNAYVLRGGVPIVGRTVLLDISAVARGDYWLDIVVRKPGRDPVRARRAIVITDR